MVTTLLPTPVFVSLSDIVFVSHTGWEPSIPGAVIFCGDAFKTPLREAVTIGIIGACGDDLFSKVKVTTVSESFGTDLLLATVSFKECPLTVKVSPTAEATGSGGDTSTASGALLTDTIVRDWSRRPAVLVSLVKVTTSPMATARPITVLVKKPESVMVILPLPEADVTVPVADTAGSLTQAPSLDVNLSAPAPSTVIAPLAVPAPVSPEMVISVPAVSSTLGRIVAVMILLSDGRVELSAIAVFAHTAAKPDDNTRVEKVAAAIETPPENPPPVAESVTARGICGDPGFASWNVISRSELLERPEFAVSVRAPSD
jgi:hypothetical protein